MDFIKNLFAKICAPKSSSYLEFQEKLPDNPEEFKVAHHQIVMKEISKYEDAYLAVLKNSQIKRIGKEIGLMIATSLSAYPNTAESDEEVLGVCNVLAEDRIFRESIRDCLLKNYLNSKKVGTNIERFYKFTVITCFNTHHPTKVTGNFQTFLSIRQGKIPESYFTDVLAKIY